MLCQMKKSTANLCLSSRRTADPSATLRSGRDDKVGVGGSSIEVLRGACSLGSCKRN